MKSLAAALVASTLSVLSFLAEYHDMPESGGWRVLAALGLGFFVAVALLSSTPRPTGAK